MHEIVTIQIGKQSNYLGAHFWNAQESYFTYAGQQESPVNHDIHFRAGVGNDGTDTFTPRTIVYDLKHEFGALRRINELYEVLAEQGERSNIWRGPTVEQRQPLVGQSAYQSSLSSGEEPPRLTTSSVRYWSDFNRVFYHPRSIVQIYETELNPGQRAFNDWNAGEELFSSMDKEEAIVDRDVRPFVEECDQMQGIQMLSGMDNAWAGFSAKYMDQLRDEFGKLPIWVWGVGEASEDTTTLRAVKSLNQARSTYEISQQASFYVPLAAPPVHVPDYISMSSKHPWHTSAVQATALESVLLPTRLKRSDDWDSVSLDHLVNTLNVEGDQRIAQLSFSLPHAVTATQYTNGNAPAGNLASEKAECSLFPMDSSDLSSEQYIRKYSKVQTYRQEPSENSDGLPDADHYAREDSDEAEGRRLKLQTTLPFPLPTSFPEIYSLSKRPAHTTAARASLSVSSLIGHWVKSMEQATRMRVGIEEREELSNGLLGISEAYGLESFSDSDMDDGWDV